MTELERALVAVGQELELPPQPDLVAGVRVRLERRRPFGWRAVAFAAALVAVAFGIAMAVPPARSAILRFFHIGAATVEQVDTLPAARRTAARRGARPAAPATRSRAARTPADQAAGPRGPEADALLRATRADRDAPLLPGQAGAARRDA